MYSKKNNFNLLAIKTFTMIVTKLLLVMVNNDKSVFTSTVDEYLKKGVSLER